MTEVTTFPAPEISKSEPPGDSWGRERRAFHAALPSLLANHRGRFVAIHEGLVVAEGPIKLEVARMAYDRVGYVPIYVGHVADLPEAPARLPSPSAWRRASSDPAR